jgi:molybdopterin-containing oxidoreductase family membrane subunit
LKLKHLLRRCSLCPTIWQKKKKLIEKIGAVKPSQADDLKVIKGVGPKLEKALNDLGIYTYEQLSRLSDQEYEWIDQLLHVFQGRSKRDHWAEQAQELLEHA